ncbi:type I phosphomannose isomerase catalytic subunit [Anaerococcus lactolyticus]|uniref:type I phosphomannose isomerase catalytic subunit n=1 Tax=Anaerococcus lactolyticus TaxID=33032 RepID=UPI00288BCB5E|nr:type I phosphomannose isomerase catalytic subunit [Anaerococcus lactolyticus]
MERILFLEGKFSEKIWGGSRLKTEYAYPIPSDKTGEYWAISGMEDASSVVINGDFKGESLRDIYRNHKDLFANSKEENFPLLVKIIDAADDLSIQVHPDDEMAARLENSKGKTECWYILNEEDASIVFGLKVKSKEEAIKLIDERKWTDLLREVSTQKGEFFFVRAGTVHAIKKDSLILEIQQASDITYRLYDYDRKDADGNLRQLHLEKSKEAIKIIKEEGQIQKISQQGYEERILTENEYFEVREFKFTTEGVFKRAKPYLLESVIEGEGEIEIDGEVYPLKKGDFFIITNFAKDYKITGKLTIIEANPMEV